VNKLWNAARFSLMHLDGETGLSGSDDLSVPDRWVLSRLHQVTLGTAEALDAYRFNDAAALLYQFVWHEFCDWYVEAAKPALYGAEGEARQKAAKAVLCRVLQDCLVLLHPFVPFVTEEIWSKLPGERGSIMKAPFPTDDGVRHPLAADPDAALAMERLMAVVTAIRTIRGEMNLPPALKLTVVLQSEDDDFRRTAGDYRQLVVNLARLAGLAVEPVGRKPRAAATAVIDGATIFVPLEGVIDFEQEVARLRKEMGKVDAELDKISRKLGNADFLRKAPEAVVAKVRDQHETLIGKRGQLEANLGRIASIAAADADSAP
jgi:valyl-tRNA synthetase